MTEHRTMLSLAEDYLTERRALGSICASRRPDHRFRRFVDEAGHTGPLTDRIDSGLGARSSPARHAHFLGAPAGRPSSDSQGIWRGSIRDRVPCSRNLWQLASPPRAHLLGQGDLRSPRRSAAPAPYGGLRPATYETILD